MQDINQRNRNMIKLDRVYKKYTVTERKGQSLLKLFFSKRKDIQALHDLSLEIKEGQAFGLLGPNGAGKTTIIKILCGLTQPTCGRVTIDERPVDKSKKKIGVMLGSTMIYYRITGFDNLEYFARLYGVPEYKKRIEEMADFLGLKDFIDDYPEVYSEGMKKKLALARALIHNPDILLLDEPTNGLDPRSSFQIRKRIAELKAEDKTVLLCTHDTQEAEFLCDRVGILNKGKLVTEGAPDSLKESVCQGKRLDNLNQVFMQVTGELL